MSQVFFRTSNLLSAFGLLLGVPLHAEEVYIDEIVVTAQKRAQSLSDVPIAASAFTGAAIEEAGLNDAKTLVWFTPGLSGASKDSFVDTISVRGISTNDFGIGGDPSIALFKNGVYSGRTGEVVTSFFDMERIEVLKGPQGLLFGRGAASGAIHQITAKPDPTALSGEVNAEVGERGVLEFDGHINVPLSESLALRLAAMHSEEDGYVNNTLGGDDVINHDRDAVRLSLGYDNGPWRWDLAGEFEDRRQSSSIYVGLTPTGEPISGDERTFTSELFDDSLRDESEIFNLSLEVNYDFENATLTSITGVRSHEFAYLEDPDAADFDLLVYAQDQEGDYFSQEFRLVSAGDRKLNWFVGVSGFWDEIDADFSLAAGEETICFLFVGFDCNTIFGGTFTPNPDGLLESGSGDSESLGFAIYGDLEFVLSEQWTAKLGARYSYDEREYMLVSNPVESELAPAFGRLGLIYGFDAPAGVKTKKDWSKFSPRGVLEFRPNDDFLGYVSISTGFKPGAFDSFTVSDLIPGFPSPLAAPGAEVNNVKPEEVISYEIGAKGTLFEGRARYALSAYYYDYTDLQQQVLVGPIINIENVGEAEGYGVEGEFTARPNEYIDLFLGFAWADSEVRDIDITACALPNGDNCDGNRLTYNPDFTLSAQITGRFPVGSTNVFGVAQVAYSDDFFAGVDNREATRTDSFTEVNLRVGVELAGGTQITAYLENAFDEEHFDLVTSIESLGIFLGVGPSRPRTFGVRVSVPFGG